MISKEQIEQYNEEGYTIVEDVFDKDELNPILNEFDEIVDDFAEKAFQAGKIPVSYTHLTLPTMDSV